MPEWWFYHLEKSGPEHAAGPLLEKCLERGWRVLVVSSDEKRRAALDAGLWTYSDDSFLPHGQAEAAGLDPKRQPILISGTAENENDAAALLLLDGMDVPTDAPFERCMVMFEGADTITRDIARAQFKAAKDAGLTCRYFQQTARDGWKEAGK
ncbi:MAG: DNA polymerase III subunit chi [Pseudomonadota bacterium]